MTNCEYIDCKSKISKIIGNCKDCNMYFCSKHRYNETHNCPKLLEIKLLAKQNLVKKLQECATHVTKLTKI